MSDFDELYQDLIMDHYRRPRGRAELSHVPADHLLENPTCGDSIKLEILRDEEGRIAEVRHQDRGCAISTASASLMTEFTKGMTLVEAREAAASFIGALRGDTGIGTLDAMGDLAALRGVAGLPVRVKCATLAWHALLDSLDREEGS